MIMKMDDYEDHDVDDDTNKISDIKKLDKHTGSSFHKNK